VTNQELLQLRQRALPRGISTLHPVFVERARNAELWDVEGRRYIDFGAGIAVLNTGHLHPKVQAAAAAQLDKVSHAAFQLTGYHTYLRLADRLNKLVPVEGDAKTVLFSSGAEAVENAVKIARAHTGRQGVIAFTGAFHGRTMMTMALTGKVVPYKEGFGPMPADVYRLPFPVEYHGVSVEDTMHALQQLFKTDVDPKRIAAIIIEPIQGEGGFYVASTELMTALRKVCDDYGMLLIADEVQSGFARSGKLFALEHTGVKADLVTMAKGLAGGFPLSAVSGRAEVMDAPLPGGLGGTYAGSPIACAAAEAVLDVIEEEKLCDRANKIGQLLRARLEPLQKDPALKGVIGEIRGRGAMLAVELVQDGDANRPNADLTRALVEYCAKNGLIILSCGVRANVIRFLLPLTIEEKLVEEGMDILIKGLRELAQANYPQAKIA